LPAGGGKTRTAIGGIAKLETPTLILVASLDLAEQWRTQIGALLGAEVGLVGDGAVDVRPITVATVQTLARWDDRDLDAFLARFGLLVIDEAHHVASPTFRRVVGRCPAKYRLALTATPEREDGLTPVLEWFCGPVIASVRHAELIEEGNLVDVETRELRTQFGFNYGGPDDWPRLLDALWRDNARNALIVSAVESEARAGHSVLVLTGRVEHARVLAEQLLARGVNARALVGTMSRRERSQALQDSRDGQLSVLVATSLADEGLDLPRLSRCFLTFPAKAAGRTEQRLGRIMRPHGDKRDAVLIDVVDARVGVLRHQARKRAAVFRRVLGSAEARNAA
jgi:superfamily II DNA or RNA helicase